MTARTMEYMGDWLDDPNLSDEEKLARFEALEDGGEVQFAPDVEVLTGRTSRARRTRPPAHHPSSRPPPSRDTRVMTLMAFLTAASPPVDSLRCADR